MTVNETPPPTPSDGLSVSDLRVIAGWLLANYGGPLGAPSRVVEELGRETGLNLSTATTRQLLNEAIEAVGRWTR